MEGVTSSAEAGLCAAAVFVVETIVKSKKNWNSVHQQFNRPLPAQSLTNCRTLHLLTAAPTPTTYFGHNVAGRRPREIVETVSIEICGIGTCTCGGAAVPMTTV